MSLDWSQSSAEVVENSIIVCKDNVEEMKISEARSSEESSSHSNSMNSNDENSP